MLNVASFMTFPTLISHRLSGVMRLIRGSILICHPTTAGVVCALAIRSGS